MKAAVSKEMSKIIQQASQAGVIVKGNVLYAMVVFAGTGDTSPIVIQSYEPLFAPQSGQPFEVRKDGVNKVGLVASANTIVTHQGLGLNVTISVVLS